MCEYCINIEFKFKALGNVALVNKIDYEYTNKFHATNATLCKQQEWPKEKCTMRQCEVCGIIPFKSVSMKKFNSVLEARTTWEEWDDCVLRGKKKKMLIDNEGTVLDLIEKLSVSLECMSLHLFSARWQRKQFQDVRDNPPKYTIVCVADFAMNYRCVNQDEISSAFCDYAQATMHPIVSYYVCPNQNCEVVEGAAVFISSDLKHDAHAVHRFNSTFMSHLEQKRKLTFTSYQQWSDGCASQYKGKTLFHYMTEDPRIERFYFGTRHGKSVCDSLGGVVKKTAERFVKAKRGKIRNACELYNYCNTHLTIDSGNADTCEHKRRVFFYEDDIDRPDLNLIGMKETQEIHHVKVLNKDVIQAPRFTCSCNGCRTDSGTCSIVDSKWRKPHTLVKKQTTHQQSQKKSSKKITANKAKKSHQIKIKQPAATLNKKILKTKGDDGKKNLKKRKMKGRSIHNNTMLKTKGDDGMKNLKKRISQSMSSVEPFPNIAEDTLTFINLGKSVDCASLSLLPIDSPPNMFPAMITGDGNCLSRSLSLLTYGSESKYMDMKIKLAHEMLENELFYLGVLAKYVIYSDHYHQGMDLGDQETLTDFS